MIGDAIGNPARRSFMRLAGAAAAATAFAPARLLAQPHGNELTSVALRDGLAQIEDVGGNVLVLETADGLVMVDSGAPEHAASLMRWIGERYAGVPIRVLLNTHWHLEHTGGNDAVGEAGATIVSHENTRLWMSTGFYVEWQDKMYAPRAHAALPTSTFYSSDPQPIGLDVGGHEIVYAHLKQAHTDGDIYVRFPSLNVIAAGGAVYAREYPIPDYVTGGWIGGTIDAARALIEMSDDDTLIVPHAGPVQSRADLEAQVEMLEVIRVRIEEMAVEGKGAAEMLDAGITRDYDGAWRGDSRLFIENVYEGLWWGNRLRGIVA